LTCKSDCEYKQTIWNDCVAKIMSDPKSAEPFEERVDSLSMVAWTLGTQHLFKGSALPAKNSELEPFSFESCDISGGVAEDIPLSAAPAAYLQGRNPRNVESWILAADFPKDMETNFLHPAESSKFMLDGIVYDVPCFHTRNDYAFSESKCPQPRVDPERTDSSRTCVKPCPSPAHSEDEHTTMWTMSTTDGRRGRRRLQDS
jgi:hypothetical protein